MKDSCIREGFFTNLRQDWRPEMAENTMIKTLATQTSPLKIALLSVSMLSLSGCGLASLPGGYTPIEKQTVSELSVGNYTPRTADERAAIQTQELFAQAAFWSREFDLNPADLEAAINLASTLRRLGNPSKAVEVATQTRALYPRDVSLMTELAAAQISNNQTNKALKIINEALAQNPRSARLWSMKGAAMDQMDNFTQARQYYSKAMQIDPNNSGVMANIGLSYALEGDPRTAEVWLRRAANAPNASATVRQNLSLVLGLQGKTEEAQTWANRDLDQSAVSANAKYMNSLRGSQPVGQTPQTVTNPTRRGPARAHNRTQQQNRTYGYVTLQQAPKPVQNSMRQNSTGQRPTAQYPTAHLTSRPTPQRPMVQNQAPQAMAPQQYSMHAPVQQQAINAMPEFAGAPKTASTTLSNANTNAPTAPMSVLDKIARNTQSKISVAQNQQAQLQARAQQRAAQQYAMQQQQGYRPQPVYANTPQPAPQYRPYPQYTGQQQMPVNTQAQIDPRRAARTRRR